MQMRIRDLAQTFDIHYTKNHADPKRNLAPSNPFKLRGAGKLGVTADEIVFSGYQHDLLSWRSDEGHRVPLSAVWDVQVNGHELSFVLHSGDGKSHLVVLQAADAAMAQEIMAYLPDRQSEDFSNEKAAWSDFQERLFAFQSTMPVTYGLIALNVLVFVLMLLFGAGFLVTDGNAAIAWGANFGPLTLGGDWWRLVTSMFVHFGIFHLGMNMFSLYMVGGLVERLFGSMRFLLLYLVAGLCGSMISLVWHPDANSAGASGAIFAIFGALAAYLLDSKNAIPVVVRRKMLKDMAVILIINLVFGMQAGIDNAAHIGGLIAGVVLGFILARPLPFLPE